MSYNISSVRIVQSTDLSISRSDLDRLAAVEDSIPECCFLTEEHPEEDGVLKLKNLWWYGEGSRTWEDFFTNKVARCLRGSVIVVVTWEGGDSIELVKIDNGKMTSVDLVEAVKTHPEAAKLLFE